MRYRSAISKPSSDGIVPLIGGNSRRDKYVKLDMVPNSVGIVLVISVFPGVAWSKMEVNSPMLDRSKFCKDERRPSSVGSNPSNAFRNITNDFNEEIMPSSEGNLPLRLFLGRISRSKDDIKPSSDGRDPLHVHWLSGELVVEILERGFVL